MASESLSAPTTVSDLRRGPSPLGPGFTRRSYKVSWPTGQPRYYWTVEGPEGTVAFLAGPSGIPAEMLTEHPSMGESVDGIPWIGWDLGGHARERINHYDGYHTSCLAHADQQECYYNSGTALGAAKLLEAWTAAGLNEEVIFARLEELYPYWMTKED